MLGERSTFWGNGKVLLVNVKIQSVSSNLDFGELDIEF